MSTKSNKQPMLGFPKLPLGLNGDIPRYLHALHMRLAAEKLTYVLAFLPRVSEMRFVELTDTNMPVKMFMGKNLALVYAYPDGTAVRTYFTTQISEPIRVSEGRFPGVFAPPSPFSWKLEITQGL
jgi:hypothetical protein